MTITTIDWIIFTVMTGGLLAVGYWTRRFVKGVADFTVGGRKMGMWLGLGASSADGIAVASIVAICQESYLRGFSYAWLRLLGVLVVVPLVGIFGFGLPSREINIDAANDYIISLMREEESFKGFALADPYDTKKIIRSFEKAVKAGVRFSGVKPYYDFLGKSNFDTTMGEFIPRDLLDFMNSEKLIMILHTSGVGMGESDNQEFVISMAKEFPRIKIILAHMGRYTKAEQFYDFLNSDVMSYPSIFLGTSSVTERGVYKRLLSRADLHDRILFGSDLPYGLITGVEHWSDTAGAVFITRDDYPWSDNKLNQQYANLRGTLTYNTYHAIKALKDAIGDLNLAPDDIEELKQKIFCDNAQSCFKKTNQT